MTNKKGEVVHGFRGRPRLTESLSKRTFPGNEPTDHSKKNGEFVFVVNKNIKPNSSLQTNNNVIDPPISALLPKVQPSLRPLCFQVPKAFPTPEVIPQSLPNSFDQISPFNLPSNHFNATSFALPLTPPFTRVSIDTSKQQIDERTQASESSISTVLKDFKNFEEMFPTLLSNTPDFNSEVPNFISGLQNSTVGPKTTKPTYEEQESSTDNPGTIEENLILKHFFNTLLPLTDAHPTTPWPQLILKYCDFEVAKSCFISLAGIHLYETQGASEFYKTGMDHITNTMEYLINYLKALYEDDADHLSLDESEARPLDVKRLVIHLKDKRSTEENRTNFMVILILIHVHLLFSILESGRSALARTFFELTSAIVNDLEFKDYLNGIEGSSTLVGNIAWFDIISAMVSPDCRVPDSDDIWLGSKDSVFSTSKLMGCPPEIFKIMKRFCVLRNQFKDKNQIVDDEIMADFDLIRHQLLDYREYVDYEDQNFGYPERLKCTQCWTLALLLNLYQLIKPKETTLINEVINEFINVYSSLSSRSPIISQMVWPVFTISCSATLESQRHDCEKYLIDLYQNTKSGTVSSVIKLTKQCWTTGVRVEDILAGEEWFASGIDFLVI